MPPKRRLTSARTPSPKKGREASPSPASRKKRVSPGSSYDGLPSTSSDLHALTSPRDDDANSSEDAYDSADERVVEQQDGSATHAAASRLAGLARHQPLEDELIWSDGDEGDASGEKDEIILFPSAEELREQATPEEVEEIIRLGTRQHLDESDSSEDEATLNRVGDIPLEWYKDEDHVGYDIEGKKLLRSERSALERLLEATDDPNALRTVYDTLHDEKKVLTNADLQMIFNLQRNRTTNASYNMYEDAPEDSVVFDPLNHPLARGGGPSKLKFTPSLHDMKVIARMVRRMRKEDENKKKRKDDDDKEEEEDQVLWDDGHVEMDAHTHFKYFNRIPKPRVPPPGTYESYRPPAEYLPSERAKERQARLRAIDRREHFLPQSFDALRHVPFYHHTIQDRYQRCLDLAFFSRAQRTRLVVDPSKLLPDLPDPKDLRPYPEKLSFQYKGHTGTVRSLSVSPNGQYLATACDDHLVRVYEVHTGRLMKRYDMGAPVQQVAFCPAKSLNVLAAAVEFSLVFIVPSFAAHWAVNDHTVRFLRAPGLAAAAGSEGTPVAGDATMHGGGITQTVMDKDESAHELAADLDDVEEREKRAEFLDASAKERAAGIVVKVALHAKVKKFSFHLRGDYLCALCPKDHVKYRQTVMLQLSKRKVFCPFRKFSEVVTDCHFHPREPIFFLSTTNTVRCYNLVAHKLQRRYKAPGGVTACLAIHPDGDNFLVGDTTSHTSWYDCDFSDRPYKRMKSHKGVVTAVGFHPNTNAYPLFASGASDGQVHVFHGMVYDDYNKNALIVPVKILKHRRPVYDIAWHPTLPWLFTSTEDGTVTAWTE